MEFPCNSATRWEPSRSTKQTDAEPDPGRGVRSGRSRTTREVPMRELVAGRAEQLPARELMRSHDGTKVIVSPGNGNGQGNGNGNGNGFVSGNQLIGGNGNGNGIGNGSYVEVGVL